MKKQLGEMEDKIEIRNIHLRFLDCENREGEDIFGTHVTRKCPELEKMIAQIIASSTVSSGYEKQQKFF